MMINSLCSLNSGDSSRDDEVSLFFETIKITNKMKKLLGLLFMLPLYMMAQNETYTVTVYNAVPSQCSGNHLKTADGSLIDTDALEKGTLKWCAVSRDMLESGKFKYGDKIEILHADKSIAGIYEIRDTTNKRFTKHIDILMPKRINTGKWNGVKIKKVNL